MGCNCQGCPSLDDEQTVDYNAFRSYENVGGISLPDILIGNPPVGLKLHRCVSTELETLPQVELKVDLCADLPSKTECFGIEKWQPAGGLPTFQLK